MLGQLERADRFEERLGHGLVAQGLLAARDVSDGVVIRTRVADIRATGRDTMGVSLMNLGDDNAIVAVARGEAAATPAAETDEAGEEPVTLGPRAWPLIDMLERTSRGGPKANIVWEAASDF